MGKRSSFERKPRDFYRTPPSAVDALLPFLSDYQTYCEPCAGDGALIDTLAHAGLTCAAAYDIEPQRGGITQRDALTLSPHDLCGAEVIITNPPWERRDLHKMITHFAGLGVPTWLLFDADWMHTKQSAPFLPNIRKIVSIGRVKWFGNTAGKDNACWHEIDFQAQPNTPKFYGRKA